MPASSRSVSRAPSPAGATPAATSAFQNSTARASGTITSKPSSPFEAGLGWTVALDEGREFTGRDVLVAQKHAGAPRQVIGLVLDDKGVLRHGQAVFTAAGEGEILSGTFSPTLGKAIALARVPAGVVGAVEVDIRGRRLPVRVVKYPFVRDGVAQPGVLG